MSADRSMSRAEYHELRRADYEAHKRWLAELDRVEKDCEYADRGGWNEIRWVRERKPIPQRPRPEPRPELRIDNSKSYARRVVLNRRAARAAAKAEHERAIAAFSDSIVAYYRKAA